MADITITGTSVRASSDSQLARVQFGEAVTAGQALYYKSSDNKWWKAAANTTAELAGSGGLAMAFQNGDADGYGSIIRGGTYTCGGTVTEGDTIWLSGAAAGGITLTFADLVSTWNVSIIGVAGPSNTIKLVLFASGHTIP